MEAKLREYLDPDAVRIKDLFVVEIGGRQWTVATDGRWLVAALGAHGKGSVPLSPSTQRLQKSLTEVTSDAMRATTEIPLAELVAWCGPCEPPHKERCEDCVGCGTCCNCGEGKCPGCEGSGHRIVDADMRPGVICGVRLNRNRLAKVLEVFTGNAIRVDEDRDSKTDCPRLNLASEDRLAVLMGLKAEPGEASAPVFEDRHALAKETP